MTAPAPGTKEFEEVQPNWDLLVYFCVSRAPPAALLRQPAFGSALSAEHFRPLYFGSAISVESPHRGITAAQCLAPTSGC